MTIRARAIQRSLLGALLAVPFMLGNRGCESQSESDSNEPAYVHPNEAPIGEPTPVDGTHPDKTCDACPGPAPAAPTTICADGSTGGPNCAPDASGVCAWSIRSCPPSDEGNGKLVTCEDALCGEVPDAPVCSDNSAGVPSCIKHADGTCAWKFSCGGVDGPDAGVDPGSAGTFCGGIAGIGCPDGQYCNFGSTCGAGDQGGKCEPKPEACTLDVDPVCGCDEKTYSNACAAAGAGISVLRGGACDEPVACDSCKGPAPGAPNYQCKDGTHFGGPACVTQPGGACGWQFLKCPEEK